MRESQTSLTDEERKEKIIYSIFINHCLAHEVDDNIYKGIYMHTSRESHVDSDGEG